VKACHKNPANIALPQHRIRRVTSPEFRSQAEVALAQLELANSVAEPAARRQSLTGDGAGVSRAQPEFRAAQELSFLLEVRRP